MHTAPADTPGPGWSSHSWRIDPGSWRGLSPQLRRLRRLLLLIGAIPVIVLVSLIGGAFLGLPGLAVGAVPTAATVWGWRSIGRAWSAWRYAEREEDLLISHGTFVRRLVVVPYGRMQLVDVTAGPLAQRFGIAQVRLHTAAATTDAVIPGLSPVEAARLRDSLTERGEAQAAVL